MGLLLVKTDRDVQGEIECIDGVIHIERVEVGLNQKVIDNIEKFRVINKVRKVLEELEDA